MQHVQSSVGSPLPLNELKSRAVQGEGEESRQGGRKHHGAAGELGSSHLPCLSVPPVKGCERGHEGGAKREVALKQAIATGSNTPNSSKAHVLPATLLQR